MRVLRIEKVIDGYFLERERKKKIRKDSDIMKDTFDDDHR